MAENNNNNLYKIRPSARLIKTIGDNLIKDTFAAIVELVKNSYDADASNVIIEFSNIIKENNSTTLSVQTYIVMIIIMVQFVQIF